MGSESQSTTCLWTVIVAVPVGVEESGPRVPSAAVAAAAAAAVIAIVGLELVSEKACCTKIECYFYPRDQ